MGDQQQRAAKTAQIALQPLHRFGVEMVGGLVHQQGVGVGQQGGGDRHPLSIPPRQIPHLGLKVIDAQPTENRLGVGF